MSKTEQISPFAEWLINFAKENQTSITAIARKAGLSPGTLRYLVLEPGRKPSIETCLQLSAISGRSVDELLILSRQREIEIEVLHHPDRLKLINIYDGLPVKERFVLVAIAKEIQGLAENKSMVEDL